METNIIVDNSTIQSLVDQIYPKLIEFRRHLHMHPELSFQEEHTSAFVCDKLREFGIEYKEHVGGFGVVGYIKGGKSDGSVVALRADMDALPIQEENDVPYRSVYRGVMHACGHDVHTTNLLGVACVLNELKDDLKHDIRLIFQPAEERIPGGASLMIKEGVLKDPVPKCIYGFHVYPQMEVGQVGLRAGNYMASADEIYVTVYGKGGHGAVPHDCIDPIVITSHIITGLQSIVSRNADPTTPSVLTFGKIQSTGGATNIIPNEVKLEGTFRTYQEDWRYIAHELMTNQATKIAEAFGGTCDFRIEIGYPVLVNHEALTQEAHQTALELLGLERVHLLPMRMTAEDFAYYSHVIPAVFMRIGTSNQKKKIGAPLHTPQFDVDESCFLTSVPLMVKLAMKG